MRLRLATLPALLLLLAACQQPTPPVGGVAVAPAARPVAVAGVPAAVAAGQRQVVIQLLPPNEFTLAAVVHRWVPADVFEYRAVLRHKLPADLAFADFSPVLSVTCAQKGDAIKTTAAFTDLSQGKLYEVELEAWGNVGGTAATTRLNTKTLTKTTFDFSASNDVEDTRQAKLAVSFDPVPFSGSGSIDIKVPAEGTFTNPSASPTALVQGAG